MSLFYYFVSTKPLPDSVIEQAHMSHHSIDDITKYVKDAKEGHYYYDCNPGAVYINDDEGVSRINFEEIISRRMSGEDNVLLNISKKFSRLGNFYFIKMWEDTKRCDTGYFEAFFQQCRHDYMSFEEFCKALENKEMGIETDVFYYIKVSE